MDVLFQNESESKMNSETKEVSHSENDEKNKVSQNSNSSIKRKTAREKGKQ